MYVFIHFGHEEFFIKRYLMAKYKVNVNDIFDQDEAFLFEQKSFRGLIKRMHDNHIHLINPNFDLSAIVNQTAVSLPEKVP